MYILLTLYHREMLDSCFKIDRCLQTNCDSMLYSLQFVTFIPVCNLTYLSLFNKKIPQRSVIPFFQVAFNHMANNYACFYCFCHGQSNLVGLKEYKKWMSDLDFNRPLVLLCNTIDVLRLLDNILLLREESSSN
jgi:hypothetical protein